VLSVLLTYSRGGFLGLAVVLLVLMLRSRWKLVTLPAAAGAALMLVEFLPDHWFDRMNTVTTYEQDSSAMTRLWAWGIAWQIARESPLVGGGFGVFTKEVWQRFMPDYHSWHNAHSIYFQVLAEHGFTGLILFCALLLTTFATLFGVRRALRRQADAAPLRNASYAVEASLIGFVVSGAFLNLAYFDLVYFLIGIAIILRTLARREQPVAVPTEVTATTPSPVRVIAWRPS
jgi:putative inorganic carbon (HCO3(-)) transporter